MKLTRLKFYLEGVLIENITGDYSDYASKSDSGGANNSAVAAFDTDLPMLGDVYNVRGWEADNGYHEIIEDQRLICVRYGGKEILFDEIVGTNQTVDHVKIYITTDAYITTTYDAAVPNSL